MTRYRFDQIAENSTAKKKPEESDRNRYVGLEHLDPGTLEVTRWGAEVTPKGDKLLMKKGDILFGRRRAYQKKVGIAPFDGIFSAHGMVLRPKADVVDPMFFPFFISSDIFLDEAIRVSVGSLSPTANWKDLRTLEFDLPSPGKQRELAGILSEAESLKGHYRKLLTTCDDVVKSQFVDAVQSAHNPSFVRLDDLVREGRPITYGIVKPGGNVEGGIPIIKVKDYPNGTIDESNLLYASPAIEEKYARSRLKQGDLLFSIRGSVGRMAFVPESLVGANLTQDTARLSLREELDPEYIRGVLRLPEVDHWIRHHIKGVAVQGVNLRDLRNLEIPILSEDKQAELGRFATSVDKSKFKLGICGGML